MSTKIRSKVIRGVLVNNIAKSAILDVVGVSGYSESCHPPSFTVQICCPGDTKLLTSQLFLLKKKTQGTGKTNIVSLDQVQILLKASAKGKCANSNYIQIEKLASTPENGQHTQTIRRLEGIHKEVRDMYNPVEAD